MSKLGLPYVPCTLIWTKTSTGTNKMRKTNALYLKTRRLIAETHRDTNRDTHTETLTETNREVHRHTHTDTHKDTHKETLTHRDTHI